MDDLFNTQDTKKKTNFIKVLEVVYNVKTDLSTNTVCR